MHTAAKSSAVPTPSAAASSLPETFLSCYEILNPNALRWAVRLYKVRQPGGDLEHADRGAAKQVVWDLQRKHRDVCQGRGYVVDIDEETVAVPAEWNIPSDVNEGAYLVTFEKAITTDPNTPAHRSVITGILREAIKSRFKHTPSDTLGELWQDFDRFCQVPDFRSEEDYHFCRKFGAVPKVLKGNRWVIQIVITTASLDGWTFAEYFRNGRVRALTGMIEAKQVNRINRRNRPAAVRVLRTETVEGQPKHTVVELEKPNLLEGFATMSRQEQAKKAGGAIRCIPFKGQPVEVAFSDLRLVLDTQITQGDHSQTILDPADRNELASTLQDFLDGMEVGRVAVSLSETPVDAASFQHEVVAVPAVRVKSHGTTEQTIPAPRPVTEESLKGRGQQRRDALKKFGYLQGHSINPLLAWPKAFGAARAKRMAEDVNRILASAGITFHFNHFLYGDVEELRRHVQKNRHDALLAVLPEGWREPFSDDNTHEQIKQRIDVPSQCILHEHTLPEVWVSRGQADIQREEWKLARRITQRYELCLWNLFAKLGWVPFAPADPFAYNLHLGLDVGGRHNNRAMACLGYGFATPRDGLFFRAEEIAINVQKAEPIPTESLKNGLMRLFEHVHADLSEAQTKMNLEKALFFRDGMLLGDGDEWNEIDALRDVHAKLRKLGWVSDKSVWTAVEVMKNAEEWRVMRGGTSVSNPLVGQCVFPFDDENTGLVCTTGLPYLPQGTASPLKIGIVDIHGRAVREEVIRDLVWEADMCFTKPDMGMGLPWVLHVADAGALQASRAYKISGLTL
ncbi:hypothetical protein VT84_07450 [Gemmata sp. SH-PL17]|uniref:hypothetical protein n=1 Tax=Gemmata sp. SH-PL17 TaxID=1630693 RepID=UPI00078C0812|nr:hypothetical protein [Gemmata sp. SH-PL17]AMV24216.1 hypothetical protein VT84_07450 [Gemmata sp. SH-PL17]